MNSSGIKRGLAVSAVSAMAVAGLPLLATSASAVTLANSVATADTVVIAAPDTATVSTKNDGQNTTVRLETLGGNNVQSVKYEYSLNPGAVTPTWTTIATVTRNDNGAFSHEWAATGLDGATGVAVRATGLNAAGTAIGGSVDTQTVAIDSTAASVNVNDGATIGVFQKPAYDGGGTGAAENVIVSGTSSAPAATPALAWWDADTDAVTPGNQSAYVNSGTAASTTAAGATTGTWTGVTNINGYDYGTSDELLIKATATTDDAEAYALYKQVITTVTATANRTNVPTGQFATITVTVLDQSGKPIAGAEVRDSDGTRIDETNSKGQVTTTQGAGSKYYYANTTDSNPYEAELGDKKSDTITVTQYAPAPTSLAGASNDGSAFDFNEYAATDITVQVKDQNGNNYDTTGQALQYYWVLTRFDGTTQRYPAATATPNYSTQPTETNGKFVVPLPTTAPADAGTFELFAGLAADPLGNGAVASSKVLTVKAGDSAISYDEKSPEQAVAGTSEVVGGKLTLADGTGLVNRRIDLNYTRGTGTDSSPDAGFVQADGTIGLTRTVKTAADGSFSVTVKDPSETPQGTETGGKINGGTVNSDFANADGVNDGDAAETAPADQQVDFVASLAPGSIVIAGNGAGYDTAAERPGEIEDYKVTVMSGDQDPSTTGVQDIPLSNQDVTLTIDHGFFTNGAADPAPAAGNDSGEWKSLGQTITVQTDGSGVATFKVAIERDAGFDDDGKVTSTITATAGSVSDTQTQDWNSSNPLNGGAVDVVFSPANLQESGVLPKAPISDIVWFDVFTTDQFGNRVGGEPYTVSDNTGQADVIQFDEDGTTPGLQVTSNFDADGDFYTDARSAVDQKVTASWTTETNKYNTATPPVSTAGTETLTDSETVNWYTVDFVNSVFTLNHTGGDTQPVGSTVTETYTALDQFGEPISDLYVSFFRTGPDDLQDGDGNFDGFTGQDGTIQYVFQGAKAGTATITASGRDGGPGGDVVPEAQESDSVTFTGKLPAALTLRGGDNGAADDSLLANAINKTKGATVKLFRKRADGSWKLIRKGVMNAKGNYRFEDVNDRNGNKITRYKAVVQATALTNRGVGKKKVR